MERIYHPWHLWEDYKNNFYGDLKKSPNAEECYRLYADLLGDESKFEEALRVIINEWKYSCEHNLTNEALNRIAYLGQASLALVHGIPHIYRAGYNLLSPEQQEAADRLAEKYLNLWLERQPNVTT